MICGQCKEGGRLATLARITADPAERDTTMSRARDRHAHCENTISCTCQHNTDLKPVTWETR